MSIVAGKELNKEYFTSIKGCVYISAMIILNIKNKNLIKS